MNEPQSRAGVSPASDNEGVGTARAHAFAGQAGRLPYSAAFLLTLAFLVIATSAANLGGNYVIEDFAAVLENHKPPHDTQMKSLLEGGEAEQQPGGVVLIRRLKLQMFSETGEVEMIVRAPHCFFDNVAKTVSSPGHLEARSGDGKYALEGDGFLWRQVDNVLFISNRVETLIRDDSKKPLKK